MTLDKLRETDHVERYWSTMKDGWVGGGRCGGSSARAQRAWAARGRPLGWGCMLERVVARSGHVGSSSAPAGVGGSQEARRIAGLAQCNKSALDSAGLGWEVVGMIGGHPARAFESTCRPGDEVRGS